MKKHLLIGASLLALGITTTAIYAQVTGTSVVDKMKAVAHSFTLATSLNAGETDSNNLLYSPAVRISPVFFPLTGSDVRPVSPALRLVASVKL